MATLAKAELLKYLKDAIELESSLVAQEQIRDMYKISSEKRKPEAKYQSLPEKPKTEMSNGETFGCFLAISVDCLWLQVCYP